MRLNPLLIVTPVLVVLAWPVSSKACLPPPRHEVTLTTSGILGCLWVTADADWNQGAGGLITADNNCSDSATLTCTSGCGSWTEPIIIEPGARIDQHIDATVTVDWSADGQSGQFDVAVTLRDSSESCGDPLGCAGGDAMPRSAVMALLLVAALTLMRRPA